MNGTNTAAHLRKRFIRSAMAALMLVLVLMISLINLIFVVRTVREADTMLSQIASGNGERMRHRPEDLPPLQPGGISFDEGFRERREIEAPFAARYFTVRHEADDSWAADITRIAAMPADDAVQLAKEIAAAARTKGFSGNYRYLVTDDQDVTRYIFLDRSEELYNIYHLFIVSIAIGAATAVLVFLLVWLFSKRAVAPLNESLEKQKRFITDAGHELKTPLAVISADVDVMELENGKSEWTGSIREQVANLNDLVGNLLTLSRMEEDAEHSAFVTVDMSGLVQKGIDSFRVVADTRGLSVAGAVAPGLNVDGDAVALNRLVTLLLDNALKYCADNGAVSVVLSDDKTAGNVRFEVSNPCESMPEGNLERLFDRFYRADLSRSKKTGGYGIGLSVAKAIAESHGGTIRAVQDGDRTIRFITLLPLKE